MPEIYEKLVNRDPQGFLDEITENSAIYAAITLNKADELSAELRECFLDLQRVQGAPAYLLLLALIKSRIALKIGDGDIVRITRLLVNFFVRRNLTDAPPTRDLTRLFMAYIEEIEQNGYRGAAVGGNLRLRLLNVSAADDFLAEKLHGPIYKRTAGPAALFSA